MCRLNFRSTRPRRRLSSLHLRLTTAQLGTSSWISRSAPPPDALDPTAHLLQLPWCDAHLSASRLNQKLGKYEYRGPSSGAVCVRVSVTASSTLLRFPGGAPGSDAMHGHPLHGGAVPGGTADAPVCRHGGWVGVAPQSASEGRPAGVVAPRAADGAPGVAQGAAPPHDAACRVAQAQGAAEVPGPVPPPPPGFRALHRPRPQVQPVYCHRTSMRRAVAAWPCTSHRCTSHISRLAAPWRVLPISLT